MDDELRDAVLVKFHGGEFPGEVAVAFDRETGSPGLDGWKWRFAVTDGDRVAYIEAELSGSEGKSPSRTFESAILEAAVERRIATGYYRRDWLIDELAADGPIRLRNDDLRAHPRRSESVFF